jgi:hypothetical protein
MENYEIYVKLKTNKYGCKLKAFEKYEAPCNVSLSASQTIGHKFKACSRHQYFQRVRGAAKRLIFLLAHQKFIILYHFVITVDKRLLLEYKTYSFQRRLKTFLSCYQQITWKINSPEFCYGLSNLLGLTLSIAF